MNNQCTMQPNEIAVYAGLYGYDCEITRVSHIADAQNVLLRHGNLVIKILLLTYDNETYITSGRVMHDDNIGTVTDLAHLSFSTQDQMLETIQLVNKR